MGSLQESVTVLQQKDEDFDQLKSKITTLETTMAELNKKVSAVMNEFETMKEAIEELLGLGAADESEDEEDFDEDNDVNSMSSTDE